MATNRRDEIGRAALAVLARDGARALTHRAVDAEAGLPVGSVNYYFPQRDQLLGAALDALFELDVQAVRRPRAASTTDPLSAAIADLVRTVRALAAPRARARLIARHELLCEAQRRPDFRRRFEQQRAAFVSGAEAVLIGLGVHDAALRADGLVVLVDGLVSRQVLLGSPRLTDAELAAVLRAYLEGCLPRAARRTPSAGSAGRERRAPRDTRR